MQKYILYVFILVTTCFTDDIPVIIIYRPNSYKKVINGSWVWIDNGTLTIEKDTVCEARWQGYHVSGKGVWLIWCYKDNSISKAKFYHDSIYTIYKE